MKLLRGKRKFSIQKENLPLDLKKQKVKIQTVMTTAQETPKVYTNHIGLFEAFGKNNIFRTVLPPIKNKNKI